MINTNITTDAMMEVASVFIESFNHVVSNYVGESKNHAKLFTANIILKEKPYMIVSLEGLPHITEIVFGSDANRDFILTLSFTFFSRWGHSEREVYGLINNLARGVSNANALTLNAMPKDISSRLVSSENAAEILEANKWLIVIILMQLFITVEPVKETK